MKRFGSKRRLVATLLFLASLVVSVGCDDNDVVHPPSSHVNISIVNSAGTSDMTVNVDGPGFPNEDVLLPSTAGGFVADEFPGAAGDVIEFAPRVAATTGFKACTATAEIVDGTVYGQVNINFVPGTGFEIECSSGWVESAPAKR